MFWTVPFLKSCTFCLALQQGRVLSIDGFRLSEWVAWLASDQRSSALFGTAYSRLNSHFKQGFNNVIMGMMVLFISMKCTQCNNACSGSEKCLSTYCTKCTVSLHCRTKSIYKKNQVAFIFKKYTATTLFKLKKVFFCFFLSWCNYTLHALSNNSKLCIFASS